MLSLKWKTQVTWDQRAKLVHLSCHFIFATPQVLAINPNLPLLNRMEKMLPGRKDSWKFASKSTDHEAYVFLRAYTRTVFDTRPSLK